MLIDFIFMIRYKQQFYLSIMAL